MMEVGLVPGGGGLSNVSCKGIMWIARRFNIGEETEFAGDQVVARVDDLNFVYTTLKADDGRLLQIPNNLFFQKVIKRRVSPVAVTLAAQLSSREMAELPPSPPKVLSDATA